MVFGARTISAGAQQFKDFGQWASKLIEAMRMARGLEKTA